ncbi:MAG: hypothetical protein IPG17_14515 [Sandaracinaceae bacterium]|nr:hypothetical protein [Sandaracinaceae bacterium]
MGSADDGGPDATTDAGMVQCEVEAPDMLGSEVASVVQRIAITSLVNDFAVVFRERRPTFDDLWVRVYRDTPGGVVAGSDFPITTNAGGMSVSSVSRDPALVATGSGYVAAWIDSRELGFEMWTRVLDADGVPAASLQRVTTSNGAAASPALARASDGALLAGRTSMTTRRPAPRASGAWRPWRTTARSPAVGRERRTPVS